MAALGCAGLCWAALSPWLAGFTGGSGQGLGVCFYRGSCCWPRCSPHSLGMSQTLLLCALCALRCPPPQEVVGINLANQGGREGKLSSAYRDAADRYSASGSGFRLVPFDFHKQCGATNYGRCVVPGGG